MKKTQILRIRVDVGTHAALTRYCETHGQTLSSTLRRFLSRGVRKGDDQAIGFEHVKAWKNGETRRFCADTIASLLITQALPPSEFGMATGDRGRKNGGQARACRAIG